MMLVNPLGAPTPVVPQAASPYFPSTRRFRNPLYLRIEEVPGAERLGSQLAELKPSKRTNLTPCRIWTATAYSS